MKNTDYNTQHITESALLLALMGLELKRVDFTIDDEEKSFEEQSFEVDWKKEVMKGVFFEVMAEVTVRCETIVKAGFIEDEGRMRPECGQYNLTTEIGDVHMYFDDMPIGNDEQIENIVRPQLKGKVDVWHT